MRAVASAWSFPTPSEPTQPPPPQPRTRTPPNQPADPARHLLLAEPDAVAREALEQLLPAYGWTVTSTVTMRQSMDVLDQHDRKMKWGVIDYHQPDGDGTALLAHIRDVRPRMGVVVMVGVIEPGDLNRLRAAGPDEILRKPLQLEALLDVIEHMR